MAKKKIKKSIARDSKGRFKKKQKRPSPKIKRDSKGRFKKKRPLPKKQKRPSPKKQKRPSPKKKKGGKLPGGKKYCSRIFKWFVMDISEWHDRKARPVYVLVRFEHSRSSPGSTGKQRYSKVQNHLLGTFTKQKFNAWINSEFGQEILDGIAGDDGQILGFVVKYSKKYLQSRGKKNPLRVEREKDMARLAKQAAKVAKRYKGKNK